MFTYKIKITAATIIKKGSKIFKLKIHERKIYDMYINVYGTAVHV